MSVFRVGPILKRAITSTRRHMSSSNPMWVPNAAMKRGPKYYIDMWETHEGAFGWVLMPGVPKENVTVKVIGNEVSFEGKEAPDGYRVPELAPDEDQIVRAYQGSVSVDPV